MYEANVDDVGYRLVAIYTPVREDGVEGQPISVSTEPIAVGKLKFFYLTANGLNYLLTFYVVINIVYNGDLVICQFRQCYQLDYFGAICQIILFAFYILNEITIMDSGWWLYPMHQLFYINTTIIESYPSWFHIGLMGLILISYSFTVENF